MNQAENTAVEEFFQTILENSYDAIAVVDAKGNARYISPSVVAIHGYKPEEVIGGPSMNIVHPDDMAHAQKLFSTVLAHPGKTIKGEIRIITKKGLTKNLSYRATNLLDNHIVQGIAVNFNDISDRIKAEKKLRDSEAKYALIVEKGNDGIIVGQDGLIAYANNKALELVGYTKDEAVGSSFDKFIAPEYQELVAKRFGQRMQGLAVPQIYEIELVAKNGRHIPVEINASKFEYKKKPASITVIRDVQKRKEAERAVREAAKTQSALLNSVEDLVLLTTTDFIALDFNQAFSESVGMSREALLGSDLTQYFQPDILESRIQKAKTCIKEKRMIHFQDTRNERWFDNRFFPITNEKGDVHQIAVYSRDITEEKHMREQLAEQQKLAALGQISSVIAHELNTPLATIDLAVQMLRDAVSDELRPDIETVQSEIKRAAALVRDILAFTNLGPLEFNDVNIKKIVEVSLHQQQRIHNTAHVTFDVALSDNIILGDTNKLSMAFGNVIKNAILAQKSPDESHTISIRESVDDGNVVVTVQDTGVGIDEKDIQNIFKPFFTTRERGNGLGLGLYIAEWVIQSHNGRIFAESTKGEGSTFTLTIPHPMATKP